MFHRSLHPTPSATPARRRSPAISLDRGRMSPTTAIPSRKPGTRGHRRRGQLHRPGCYELAEVATVTLATRYPVQLIPQLIGGNDVHYWTPPPASTPCRLRGQPASPSTPSSWTSATTLLPCRTAGWTADPGSTPSTATRSSGPTAPREHVDTVTFATAIALTSATWRHLHHSPRRSTWAWSSNAPPPPTPCAASAPTPSTSPRPWLPGQVERSPPAASER